LQGTIKAISTFQSNWNSSSDSRSDRFPAVVSRFPEFSCHALLEERINNVSVKALLSASGDFLFLARVGSGSLACSVLAFVSSKKNDQVDEAKAVGLTTADFLPIPMGGSDHGR